MTDTYGNSSVPGVSITTRDILEKENIQQVKDLGLVEEDSYQWSHNLKPIGSNSIKCSHCEMEEEIPELIQRSTGFRTVVYKLYVLGKFKNTRCTGKYETDHSVLNTRDTHVTTTKGTEIKVDGQRYTYAGGNEWLNMSNGSSIRTDHLVMEHGHEVMDKMPPHMVQSIGVDIASQPQFHTPDLSSAGVDTSSDTTTVNIDAKNMSIREKAAKKLCDKAGIR